MARSNVVLDLWAPLSHKQAFDRPQGLAHTWVNADSWRRLAAYTVLKAYCENVSRDYLRTEDEDEKAQHREYGDADLLVSRVVAGLLGDDMQIAVDGADHDPPDTPVIPAPPDEPGDAAGDIDRQVYDASRRVWEQRARDAIIDWEQTWEQLPALRDRQQWLRDWADSELFEQKAWECETDTIGLGDGVYVLDLSHRAGRPVLRVYDPGFYFPVLDENAAARGFPTTIHIAFEVDLDGDGVADHVRRITWELGPIEGERDLASGDLLVTDDGRMVPRAGDRLDGEGRIVRRYPWALDEDSAETCYLTDATWPLRNLNGAAIAEFSPDVARYGVNEDGDLLRRLDLQIDTIPVFHRSSTPATKEHFGRSILARVLQLLDDLASTDSDLQSAASIAGLPMVGFSGKNVPATITVAPGAAFGLGENGRMDTLDLSASVTALQGVVDDLLDRLGVNAQVPGEVTGRVEDTGAESGFARALKLGPFTSLINLLRLVADPTYRLLLKWVQRMAQSGGYLEPGPTPAARLVFGSFLPADRKQMIDDVVSLLEAKAISRTTALRMLVEAGVDIGDLAEELARIDAEDVEAARALFEATGNQDVVNARLGLPAAEPEPDDLPPAPDLPPLP